MSDAKHFCVAWVTGQENRDNKLDDCAIQGPHTRARAYEIRDEIHSVGFKASVIDCSHSLKAAEHASDLLKAGEDLLAVMELFRKPVYSIDAEATLKRASAAREQMIAAIAKAKGGV